MITFAKAGAIVEINIDGERHFLSQDCTVHGKSPTKWVFIYDYIQDKTERNFYKMEVLDINGRPSDNAGEVAQWLSENYFTGIGAGGGGGGDASAANQTTAIARLTTIQTEILDLNARVGAGLVQEDHDNRAITYNGSGDIDYIAYKLGATEVARLTFGYTGTDLTSITKT